MLVGPQPDEDEEEDDEELVDGGSGRRPSLSRAAPAERRRSGPRGGRGCRGGATDGSPGSALGSIPVAEPHSVDRGRSGKLADAVPHGFDFRDI